MKQLSEKSKMKFKRGIFIAPSLLTTCNIFCGFYAIIASINGRFYEAAVAIIIAGFFDIFDGRVARLMHSSSEFGFHLDTLADVISFGLAPSILIYSWDEVAEGGWLVPTHSEGDERIRAMGDFLNKYKEEVELKLY